MKIDREKYKDRERESNLYHITNVSFSLFLSLQSSHSDFLFLFLSQEFSRFLYFPLSRSLSLSLPLFLPLSITPSFSLSLLFSFSLPHQLRNVMYRWLFSYFSRGKKQTSLNYFYRLEGGQGKRQRVGERWGGTRGWGRKKIVGLPGRFKGPIFKLSFPWYGFPKVLIGTYHQNHKSFPMKLFI